uniref:WW domain-containing protein n=1 Tax=Chromera velia CCMP2878 TaxID=1169474 RepID=A0A0G4GZW0_9ALVE|eukprot:Cvel_5477.t1-p1 / transcript=Cvel_5477.t1 / gene=Cvel_5477 / organism=Chromera_velia_CCMP2878 / gene_product=hypothetical protein / transcript_product=hypothetical protein / location=Cvel_scaffold256:41255-50858(-) / protein_length=720 / sequence_SO=supercontig / SO=protein_coding / is_pseudo=false
MIRRLQSLVYLLLLSVAARGMQPTGPEVAGLLDSEWNGPKLFSDEFNKMPLNSPPSHSWTESSRSLQATPQRASRQDQKGIFGSAISFLQGRVWGKGSDEGNPENEEVCKTANADASSTECPHVFMFDLDHSAGGSECTEDSDCQAEMKCIKGDDKGSRFGVDGDSHSYCVPEVDSLKDTEVGEDEPRMGCNRYMSTCGKKLASVLFPGTSDSGMHGELTKWNGQKVEDKKRAVQMFAVPEQLSRGIRYLEVRVGMTQKGSLVAYNGGKRIWANEDPFPWRGGEAIKDILDDTVEFLKGFPHDIVVIDFFDFQGDIVLDDNLNEKETPNDVRVAFEQFLTDYFDDNPEAKELLIPAQKWEEDDTFTTILEEGKQLSLFSDRVPEGDLSKFVYNNEKIWNAVAENGHDWRWLKTKDFCKQKGDQLMKVEWYDYFSDSDKDKPKSRVAAEWSDVRSSTTPVTTWNDTIGKCEAERKEVEAVINFLPVAQFQSVGESTPKEQGEPQQGGMSDYIASIVGAPNMGSTAGLPPGWEKWTDPNTGKVYYHEKATGLSVWDDEVWETHQAPESEGGKEYKHNVITKESIWIDEIGSIPVGSPDTRYPGLPGPHGPVTEEQRRAKEAELEAQAAAMAVDDADAGDIMLTGGRDDDDFDVDDAPPTMAAAAAAAVASEDAGADGAVAEGGDALETPHAPRGGPSGDAEAPAAGGEDGDLLDTPLAPRGQ